jgi:hypothetical protein
MLYLTYHLKGKKIVSLRTDQSVAYVLFLITKTDLVTLRKVIESKCVNFIKQIERILLTNWGPDSENDAVAGVFD